MTFRENYIAIARRQNYEFMPVEIQLTPFLEENYGDRFRAFMNKHGIAQNVVNSKGIKLTPLDVETVRTYFNPPLKEGAAIGAMGVGHEYGSEACVHMTYMRNPLEHLDTLEELSAYPYPQVAHDEAYKNVVKKENEAMFAADKIIMGNMQCTVWEHSWYLRSMERLMMDMLVEPELAEFVFEYITGVAIERARFFAEVGCDALFLGDDIGMQSTVMMSEELYTTWIKPRLKRVVDVAKAINPEIIIFYHSCGFVEPFIDHLIEAGVEVLNPVQPECMDFEQIHRQFGDRISFHGTIGTQTTMPFGTPEEVRKEVFKHLDICGEKGGLLVCPTHVLEPEVPPENIEAYILACKEYRGK